MWCKIVLIEYPLPLFCSYLSILQKKTADSCGIRTLIVVLEGEHVDHLTTTTTALRYKIVSLQNYSCSKSCCSLGTRYCAICFIKKGFVILIPGWRQVARTRWRQKLPNHRAPCRREKVSEFEMTFLKCPKCRGQFHFRALILRSKSDKLWGRGVEEAVSCNGKLLVRFRARFDSPMRFWTSLKIIFMIVTLSDECYQVGSGLLISPSAGVYLLCS